MRLVAVKDIRNQTRATCQVHELVREADQAARWNAVFQTYTPASIWLHIYQFAFTLAQRLHDAALVLLFNIGGDQLDRFVAFAIHIAKHYARLGNCHLIAFAAHVFQQNC